MAAALTDKEKAALKAIEKQAAERESMRAEYDAAEKYIDGDMQADTEALLAQRFGASQRDPQSDNRVEAVTVALVQLYVDEMASLYSGTVERKFWRGEVEDNETADAVEAHLERIGYDQHMRSIERRVVLFNACAQSWGVEGGMVNPVVYPPQDVDPVPPSGEHIDKANQDSYLGFALNTRTVDSKGEKQFALTMRDSTAIYSGENVYSPSTTSSRTANPFEWPGEVLSKTGQLTGRREPQKLQPVIVWNSERPTGSVMPVASPTLYRANRWSNVLWSVILDVLRGTAGPTLIRTVMDKSSLEHRSPVGWRHPINNEPGEEARWESAANDFAGAVNLLTAFAKTLGLTLRLSPDDLSLERTAESGIARQIANIPKDRARKERAKWFRVMEQEYAWPRIASSMGWLGRLKGNVGEVTMTTEFHPAPLPTNRAEQIQVESHDLEIGITTPAQILAQRLNIDEAEAQKAILAMREAQGDAAQEDPGAGATFDAAQVKDVIEILSAVGDGRVPAETAKVLLMSAYRMTAEQVDGMLDPVLAKQEEEEAQPEQEPPTEGEPEPGSPPPPPDATDARRSLIEKLATASKTKPKEEEDGEDSGG